MVLSIDFEPNYSIEFLHLITVEDHTGNPLYHTIVTIDSVSISTIRLISFDASINTQLQISLPIYVLPSEPSPNQGKDQMVYRQTLGYLKIQKQKASKYHSYINILSR